MNRRNNYYIKASIYHVISNSSGAIQWTRKELALPRGLEEQGLVNKQMVQRQCRSDIWLICLFIWKYLVWYGYKRNNYDKPPQSKANYFILFSHEPNSYEHYQFWLASPRKCQCQMLVSNTMIEDTISSGSQKQSGTTRTNHYHHHHAALRYKYLVTPDVV